MKRIFFLAIALGGCTEIDPDYCDATTRCPPGKS